MPETASRLTFQDIIIRLQSYWAERGCVIRQPYDIEKGAGTLNPSTFLRALGPEPWRTAYVEPSRRPTDGRYGENPFRLQHYYQFQVLIKPAPDDAQELYIESLRQLGIDLREHDLRFVEDDWEQPTFGAAGLGWEVWLDGMEVTQFTYFQQVGQIDLDPISLEITYGLERIAMFLQQTDSVFDLEWARNPDDGTVVDYGHVHLRNEYEGSVYNFDQSDAELHFALFEQFEKEADRLLAMAEAAVGDGPGKGKGKKKGKESPEEIDARHGRVREQALVGPAYDYVLKCSHSFNLLDARGAIGVAQRAGFMQRIRVLARRCAKAYVELREAMGHPLLAAAKGTNGESRRKGAAG